MKTKRLFNYRPLCFVTLFLVAGILTAECLYPVNKLYVLIPAVLSLAVGIGLFLFSKTRRFTYMAVFFLIGLIAMFSASSVYDSRYVEDGYTAIQGKVDSEIVIEDGKTIFYVKDIVLDGEELSGRAYVRLESDDRPDFRAGDIVVIYGNFGFNEHKWFDTFYPVNVNKQTYYNMWGISVTRVADGKPSFPLNLQLNIKQMFYDYLDEDTAMICQALVLGDKFGIEDNLYEGIKASGLAHVLAVSGLHVTALASALMYLLKKTKLKPWLSFIIVAVITFFYVMLCGFTASSIRAFIMTAVLNFGVMMGFKYDKMSSLSLAGAILLITRPQSIMDAGFLLSMFSVLGIFTYYKTFKNTVEKVRLKLGFGNKKIEDGKGIFLLDRGFTKCYNKVGDVVSVSLSANLMTTPLIAYFFKSVPVLFILSNIIILPYLMFIYLILLIITLFCQLTTLWGGVTIMQILLKPFVAWTDFIGTLDWSTIDFSATVFLVIAWIVSAILSSRYIFVNKRFKFVAVTLWLALFGAIITLTLI